MPLPTSGAPPAGPITRLPGAAPPASSSNGPFKGRRIPVELFGGKASPTGVSSQPGNGIIVLMKQSHAAWLGLQPIKGTGAQIFKGKGANQGFRFMSRKGGFRFVSYKVLLKAGTTITEIATDGTKLDRTPNTISIGFPTGGDGKTRSKATVLRLREFLQVECAQKDAIYGMVPPSGKSIIWDYSAKV